MKINLYNSPCTPKTNNKKWVVFCFILFSIWLSAVTAFTQASPLIQQICASSNALPGECFPTAEQAGALGCQKYFGETFKQAIPGGSSYEIHRIHCEDQDGNVRERFGADPHSFCAAPNHSPINSDECTLPPNTINIGPQLGQGQCTVGNPIAFMLGNKYQEVPIIDYGYKNLSLSLFYNSETTYKREIPFGINWSHSYGHRILFNNDNMQSGAVLRRPDGQMLEYGLVSNQWEAIIPSTEKLTSITDSSGDISEWEFTTQNNSIETYNHRGLLKKISFLNGTEIQLTHDESNKLIEVTSNRGQSLQFYSDAKHRIERVTSHTGDEWLFQYDNHNNLTNITFPDQSQRTYHYENTAFPNKLTGITDENDIRFATWSYDEQGRAIQSQHANSIDNVAIDYSLLNDINNPQVMVTNSLGKRTIYHLITIHGIRKIIRIEGEPSTHCAGANQTYTYDYNGFIVSKTDWKGNVTTYQYNDRGLEISRTEAVNTPEQRTIQTIWDEHYTLPLYKVNQNTYTSFLYDPLSRLISQSIKNHDVNDDGDSLPDIWELQHFSTLDQNDASDFDQDGASNLQEFTEGTNPADFLAVLPYRYWRLVNLKTNDNWFEISEIELVNNHYNLNALANITNSRNDDIGRLTDKNTSTRYAWQSSVATSTDFYLLWDFGDNPQQVNQIRQAGYDNSTRHLSGFTLEYSNDGIAWQSRGQLDNLPYPGNNTYSEYYDVTQ